MFLDIFCVSWSLWISFMRETIVTLSVQRSGADQHYIIILKHERSGKRDRTGLKRRHDRQKRRERANLAHGRQRSRFYLRSLQSAMNQPLQAPYYIRSWCFLSQFAAGRRGDLQCEVLLQGSLVQDWTGLLSDSCHSDHHCNHCYTSGHHKSVIPLISAFAYN